MTSSAVVSVGQCWAMYASVTQCDLLLLFCIKSRLHVGLSSWVHGGCEMARDILCTEQAPLLVPGV